MTERGNPQDALIARLEAGGVRRFLTDGLPLAARRSISFNLHGTRSPQDPKKFGLKVGTALRAHTPAGPPSFQARLRAVRQPR